MKTVAEIVMNKEKQFEPAISFTDASWTTHQYYLDVMMRLFVVRWDI
jgi:pyruvate carboxylase